MRRIILAIASLALLGPMALPAQSLGQSRDYFQIFSSIDGIEQHRWILSSEPGVPADGWVYGNRHAYKCVFWTLRVDGVDVAEVEFQRVADYLKVQDKFGIQTPVNPAEDCGPPGSYDNETKPPDLPDTLVSFTIGAVPPGPCGEPGSDGELLETMGFPSTSPMNPNVWFELSFASEDFVLIEQYRGDVVTGQIEIASLDMNLDLVTTQMA